MISETIKKIIETIKQTQTLEKAKKNELLQLLSSLEKEVNVLARTHAAGAQSITGFTQVTAHEATRPDRDRRLLDISLEGLSVSAKQFEVSHPQLVKVVNDVCSALAKLGL
jgi:hypothetical protein